MIEREDVVAAVIAAAGEKLTSRVRLQKAVYLLDQLGLGSNFQYEYHHYGPYSRELENAVADAKAAGYIEEEFAHRVSDGAMYSIFSIQEPKVLDGRFFGKLGLEETRKLTQLFAKTNVTVLELAATIDWLWKSERVKDWRSEIVKRKGVKVQSGRLEKAVDLLRQIGLGPPVPPAAVEH